MLYPLLSSEEKYILWNMSFSIARIEEFDCAWTDEKKQDWNRIRWFVLYKVSHIPHRFTYVNCMNIVPFNGTNKKATDSMTYGCVYVRVCVRVNSVHACVILSNTLFAPLIPCANPNRIGKCVSCPRAHALSTNFPKWFPLIGLVVHNIYTFDFLRHVFVSVLFHFILCLFIVLLYLATSFGVFVSAILFPPWSCNTT